MNVTLVTPPSAQDVLQHRLGVLGLAHRPQTVGHGGSAETALGDDVDVAGQVSQAGERALALEVTLTYDHALVLEAGERLQQRRAVGGGQGAHPLPLHLIPDEAHQHRPLRRVQSVLQLSMTTVVWPRASSDASGSGVVSTVDACIRAMRMAKKRSEPSLITRAETWW